MATVAVGLSGTRVNAFLKDDKRIPEKAKGQSRRKGGGGCWCRGACTGAAMVAKVGISGISTCRQQSPTMEEQQVCGLPHLTLLVAIILPFSFFLVRKSIPAIRQLLHRGNRGAVPCQGEAVLLSGCS